MILFTVEKLNELLHEKKKLASAPGIDKLSLMTISKFNNELKSSFVNNINEQWKKGKPIKLQKTANIIPIAKPNKDLHDIKSYRPVSLICNSRQSFL
jgi:hypothetical protein